MTVHLIIKGKVHGVFFRATAKEVADKYNLKGWVKNTVDNHVEVLVNGNEKEVQDFIEWCHEGPRHARVSAVVVEQIEEQELEAFKVIRSH